MRLWALGWVKGDLISIYAFVGFLPYHHAVGVHCLMILPQPRFSLKPSPFPLYVMGLSVPVTPQVEEVGVPILTTTNQQI